MPFDLATAKPVSGGFDLSTAKPVEQAPEGKGFFQTIGEPINNASLAVIRAGRDIIDTGAEALAAGYDKLRGTTPSTLIAGGEQQRVKNINAHDLADYEKQTEGSVVAPVMRVAGQAALTAPVGGLIAKGLTMIPKVAAAVSGFVQAVKTAGMSANGATGVAGMATRAAGGAVTGGATAAAIHPEDATTGAVIGAAAPPVIAGMGKAGSVVGSAIWDTLTPEIQKRAVQLAEATGKSVGEVLSALNQQGPSLIPGSQKTVPQILQDPTISQVARTLKSSGQTALGEREALNSQAQIVALERVAPTAGTINEARANVGNATAAYAKAGEKTASAQVGALFNAIPKDEAKIKLPFGDMQAAIDKYLGRGSFGEGEGAVSTAMSKAKQIGTEVVPAGEPEANITALNVIRARNGKPAIASATPQTETVAKAVPFDELQHLRSSIGEAAKKAKLSGDLQASAALRQMNVAIDNKMGAAVGGMGEAGETFTPAAADAYGQALAAHGAKKERFAKGPQAAIFRTGADGLPAKEGAEVAPLFWNSGNAQIENMQAFKQLTKDDQGLMRLMKSNATTEALQQGAKGPMGALTFDAFNKWMKSHAGAAKELFTEPELATLKAIQNETRTATIANTLGQAQGSNTAQNLFSMGALGNPRIQSLMNNIPLGIGKYVAGPAFAYAKGAGEKSRNDILSRLMVDPAEMAGALQAMSKRELSKAEIAKMLASPKIQQLMYRTAPVTSAQ